MNTSTITYRFNRIGENQIRIRFSDRPEDFGKTLPNGKKTKPVRKWGRVWHEAVLTNDEFLAFLRMEGVKLNGIQLRPNLGDILQAMIEEIKESQEKGTSYFGERVTVRTVKEDITHNPDGSINLDAEYVLVGDSGKEYDTVTIRFREAKTLLPMPEFFKVLLQLSRSGIHATKADIRRFFEVGGFEVPEEYREEAV